MVRARTRKLIVNGRDLDNVILVARRYSPTLQKKSHDDVLLVWGALMFVAIVAAHFTLNVSPGIPTGYVTAQASPIENLSLLLHAMFALFIAVLIIAIAHDIITSDDYEFYRK